MSSAIRSFTIALSMLISIVANNVYASSANPSASANPPTATYTSIADLISNASKRQYIELRCKMVMMSDKLGSSGILTTDGKDFIVINFGFNKYGESDKRGCVITAITGQYIGNETITLSDDDCQIEYAGYEDPAFIPNPIECDVADIANYSNKYVRFKLEDKAALGDCEIQYSETAFPNNRFLSAPLVMSGWINSAAYEIYCDRAQKTFYITTYQISVEANNSAYGNAFLEQNLTEKEIFSEDRVRLTAIANDGYEFKHWTDGSNIISEQADCYVVPKATTKYIAIFEEKQKPKYTIGVSVAEGNGTVTVNGENGPIKITQGESVTLVATPAEGYSFKGWKLDDTVVSTDATYSFTCTEDATYQAVFAPIPKPKYTISVSVAEGSGTVTVNGQTEPVEIIQGETVTLVATPAEGYSFKGWKLNETIVSTETTYTFTCAEDATYQAVFAPIPKPKYTIGVSVAEGNGTVTVNGQTGPIEITQGESVTLIATPAEGYSFKGWKLNETIISTEATYTFTCAEDATYQAVFAPIPKPKYTISASVAEGSGTVTVNGQTGPIEITQGEAVTLVATPAEGYSFKGWKLNETIVSTEATYTFTCAEDATYQAVFAPIPKPKYTIGVSVAEGNGTVSVNGQTEPVEITQGESVTLVATPAEGYSFKGWKLDDTIVSTEATYSFTCTGNATYQAVFAPIPKPKYTISVSVAEGNGTVTVNGQTEPVEITQGETVTLVATPAEGYSFKGWKLSETIVSTEATYSFTCTENATYQAVFAPIPKPKYTIGISVAEGNGTVTVNGQTESVEITEGESVTLVATPAEGYSFKGWKLNETIVSTDATYTFTCAEDATYKAVFAPIPKPKYTISISVAEGSGTVTVNGQTEPVEITQGEAVTLVATPAEGYSFSGWYDSNNKLSDNSEYTFTATANITITAKFTKIPLTEYSSFAEFFNDKPAQDCVIRTKMVVVGIYLDDIYILTDGKDMMITNKASTNALTQLLQRGQVIESITGRYHENKESRVIIFSSVELGEGIDLSLIPQPKDCETATISSFAGQYVKLSPVRMIKNNSDYQFVGPDAILRIDAKGDVLDQITDIYKVDYTITGLAYLSGNGLFVDAYQRYEPIINKHTISVSADNAMGSAYIGEPGTTNLECDEGSEQSLHAVANEGYAFKAWTMDDEVVGTDNPLTITVTKNASYKAVFEKLPAPEIKVTISVSVAEGSGTATVNGQTSATVKKGETVTLVATPAEGYSFKGWKLNETIVSTEATYSFTCAEDATYQAVFAPIPKPKYTISVSVAEGSGTVTINGQTGPIEITQGEAVTLIATPAEGYSFDGWYDSNNKLSDNSEYTFTATANMTITAKFTKIPLTEYSSFAEFFNDKPAKDCVIRTKMVVVGIYLDDIYILTDGKDMMITNKASTNALTQLLQRGQVIESITGRYHENKESRVIIFSSVELGEEKDLSLIPQPKECETATISSFAGQYVKLSPVRMIKNNSDYQFVGPDAILRIDAKGDVLDQITDIYKVDYTITGLAYLSGNGLFVDAYQRYEPVINKHTISVSADNAMGSAYIGEPGTTNLECDEGSEQSLHAVANEGYAFKTWTKDDEVVGTDNPLTITVTQNASYKAVFEKLPAPGIKVTISVSVAEGSGTATVNGQTSATVKKGETVTLVATPAEGYEFIEWKNGDDRVSTSAELLMTAEAEASYQAYFRKTVIPPVQYTAKVKVISGLGDVSINGTDSIKVNAGTSVEISAIPDDGYVFSRWMLNDTETELKATATVTIDADAEYGAIFEKAKEPEVFYTVTTGIGAGKGSVFIDGVSTESKKVRQGESVVLHASAGSDHQFAYWAVGADSISNKNPFTVTPKADTEYLAFFKQVIKERRPFSVSIVQAAGGTISLSDESGQNVPSDSKILEGSVITVNAIPNLGYKLSMIVVNGKVIVGNTFIVDDNSSVSAIFSPTGEEVIEIKVATSDATFGTAYIMPDKVSAKKMIAGQEVELKAVPNDGHSFVKWTSNDSTLSTLPSIVVKPTESTLYTAVFKRNETPLQVYDIMIEQPQHGTLLVTDKRGNEITSGSQLAEGSIISVKATPDKSYVLSSIMINDTALEGENFRLTENVTIRASFEFVGRNKIKIEVTTPDDKMGEIFINTRPIRSMYVQPKEKITINAVPALGVKFVEWRCNGSRFSLTPIHEITPEKATVYEARFDYIIQKSRPVAVVSGNPDKGSVRIVGEKVFAISSRKYITVEATPLTEDDKFEYWSDQNGQVVSREATFTYDKVDPIQLTAHFSSSYKVCFNVIGDGYMGITKQNGENLLSGERIKEGSVLNIQVDPNHHFELHTLTVNGDDIKRNNPDFEYKVSITEPTDIEAKFRAHPYKIRIAQCEHGRIEIYTDLYGVDVERHKVKSGEGWPYPTTLYIFAIPDEGYEVESISRNGIDFTRLNDFNGVQMAFIIVEETLNISAKFKASSSAITDIPIDDESDDGPVRYFDLKGIEHRADAPLSPGIYIRRGTKKSTVILIRP